MIIHYLSLIPVKCFLTLHISVTCSEMFSAKNKYGVFHKDSFIIYLSLNVTQVVIYYTGELLYLELTFFSNEKFFSPQILCYVWEINWEYSQEHFNIFFRKIWILLSFIFFWPKQSYHILYIMMPKWEWRILNNTL